MRSTWELILNGREAVELNQQNETSKKTSDTTYLTFTDGSVSGNNGDHGL